MLIGTPVTESCDTELFPLISDVADDNTTTVSRLYFVQAPGRLDGCLDLLQRNLIEGWAFDDSAPDQPVPLVVVIDGVAVARQVAGHYRADLAAAAHGTGRCGFSVVIPWLSASVPHIIAVQRASDGMHLAGSPCVLNPAAHFDAELEQDLSGLLDSLQAGPEQDRVLSYLLTKVDMLQQRRVRSGGVALPGVPHWPSAATPPEPPPTLAEAAGPRALVIDQAIPAESDPAAQPLLSHMRALQELDYTVGFVLAQEATPAAAAAAALEEAGIACCKAPYYLPVEAVFAQMTDDVDIVYFHRVPNLALYLPLVRRHLPRARVLFRVGETARHGLDPMAAPRAIQWTEIDPEWPAQAGAHLPPVEAALLRQATRGLTSDARAGSAPFATEGW